MQTLRKATKRIRKETDGLFAFVLLPILLVVAYMLLLVIVPTPIMAVAIELAIFFGGLGLGILLD